MARAASDPVTPPDGAAVGRAGERELRRHRRVPRPTPREGLDDTPLTPYLEASCTPSSPSSPCLPGDHATAAGTRRSPSPILHRLHADDDARSLRVVPGDGPLLDGDTDACERILDVAEGEYRRRQARVPDGAGRGAGRARPGARRGRGRAAALRRGRSRAWPGWRALEFGADQPLGAARRVRVAHRAGALRHVAGRPGPRDRAAGRPAGAADRGRSAGELPYLDLPLNGVLLAAVGVWAACDGSRGRREDGLRLLAIADRWAYNRSFPVMAWTPLARARRTRRPGPPRRAGGGVRRPAGRPISSRRPRDLLRRVTTSSG